MSSTEWLIHNGKQTLKGETYNIHGHGTGFALNIFQTKPLPQTQPKRHFRKETM